MIRRHHREDEGVHQSFVDILLILLCVLVTAIAVARFTTNNSTSTQDNNDTYTEEVTPEDNSYTESKLNELSESLTSEQVENEPRYTSLRQIFHVLDPAQLTPDVPLDPEKGFLNLDTDRPTLVVGVINTDANPGKDTIPPGGMNLVEPAEAALAETIQKHCPDAKYVQQLQIHAVMFDYPGPNSIYRLYLRDTMVTGTELPETKLGKIEIDGKLYNIIRVIWLFAPEITRKQLQGGKRTTILDYLDPELNRPLPKHYSKVRVLELPKLHVSRKTTSQILALFQSRPLRIYKVSGGTYDVTWNGENVDSISFQMCLTLDNVPFAARAILVTGYDKIKCIKACNTLISLPVDLKQYRNNIIVDAIREYLSRNI